MGRVQKWSQKGKRGTSSMPSGITFLCVFHYVPLYISLLCRFLIFLSLLPQYHSYNTPPTTSRVQNLPCPCQRGTSALSYSSTSNGISSLAGATVAFRIFNTRPCTGLFHVPAAQLHLRSRVRNQVGDEMVPVIRSGGVPVEVGRA